MSNLNKIDVPIAVEHKTKLDLSCSHITTMDFMTLQPVNYRHMIRGERISISADSVVRPAPIEVPLFGSLKQNLRYFFVPYRLVFPNWDAFYNDTISSNYGTSGLVTNPPMLTNDVLVDLFTNYSSIVDIVSGNDYDFISANQTKYRLTKKGRFIYKVLVSLGYQPLFSGSKTPSVIYNALSILALMKIYLDWYANSQYLNSQQVLLFEQLLKFNDPVANLMISGSQLYSILSFVYNVVYDNEDYYVNAWDNPVSPNSGQYTQFAFQDPTLTSPSNGAYVSQLGVNNVYNTPQMVSNPITSGSTTYGVGTTYIHEMLKRLTDYQKRHQLAGARSIDRVLAQYGFITDSLKLNRSLYLGNHTTDIEIGSVYATADSNAGNTVSTTGDYAGAAFGHGNGSLEFTADEEGVLICVASIIPSGGLVQGYDRNNLHIQKTDFFVPEFDGLGVQVLEKGEVYISRDGSFAPNDIDYQGAFGFTGRYGEYKRPKNFLSGDFFLPSFFTGGNAWHLSRLFSDTTFTDVNGISHSLDFTRGLDASQYHRIFQYTTGDYDPFFCEIRFKIASFAPCKPLFETYDFESDSKKVPSENGNKMN